MSLLNNSTTVQEVLQDEKNGKSLPWRPKKIKGLKVADSFKRLGLEKKAMRVRFCGSSLSFVKNLETGERKLHHAMFCKERLCPMCQWRKSLKVFHQVSRAMDRAEQTNKDIVPVFLTLTLRNCTGTELSDTLDTVFKGWKNVIDHRKIRKIVQGWFRALEVTYNKKDDTYHPHMHAIILVDKSYFNKDNKDYMKTTDWVHMWRTALKLDYDPICDIRKVKGGKDKYKAVAEVAKYTLKDNDFIFDDVKLTDKVIDVLSKSLKGRRLYAFGGLLKKINKQIEDEESKKNDLVHMDDEKIRNDIATIIEVYHWNFGLANYVKY